MTCVCPHCGYDLEPAAPVEVGRLTYDPRIGVMLDGKRLRMRPQLHEILAVLMRAPGEMISYFAITERLGYEGDDTAYASVGICQLRSHLRDAGLPEMIATVWGRGIRFDPTPLSPLSHSTTPASEEV